MVVEVRSQMRLGVVRRVGAVVGIVVILGDHLLGYNRLRGRRRRLWGQNIRTL